VQSAPADDSDSDGSDDDDNERHDAGDQKHIAMKIVLMLTAVQTSVCTQHVSII